MANSLSTRNWGVYCTKSLIRLLVGPSIVCTVGDGGVWLCLDRDGFDSPQNRSLLNIRPKCVVNTDPSKRYASYKTVPSRNVHFYPNLAPPKVVKKVKDLHYRFLENAAKRYKNLVSPPALKAGDEVFQYLESETGIEVPRPLAQYSATDFFDSGVNDLLSEVPTGNASPDRAAHLTLKFKRDPKVRAYVEKRAKGRCEYCGQQGFLKPDNSRYIETHHIISLANEGEDKIHNVIALCPDHHRQAHFGRDAVNLEKQFVDIVTRKKGS